MTELTPPSIIKIAKICRVLAFTDRGNQNALKGGILDDRLPIMLFNETTAVDYVNTTNPSDPTLQGMANYLYALCYPYLPKAQQIISNLAGSLPVITGPTSQSVLVGATATFSVSVVSSTTVTYQWYRGGVLIAGAIGPSYSLVNAQLTDSGAQFTVSATNAAGTALSNPAILTVTAILQGSLAYMSTDPGPTLRGGSDPFTYPNTFTLTNGADWITPVPNAATPNLYIIVKGPVGQPIKITWNNGGVNVGAIPDSNWQNTLAIGSSQYYYTRQAISLDPTQTLTLH